MDEQEQELMNANHALGEGVTAPQTSDTPALTATEEIALYNICNCCIAVGAKRLIAQAFAGSMAMALNLDVFTSHMQALVDKGLVTAVPGEDGKPRYSMNEAGFARFLELLKDKAGVFDVKVRAK